MPLAFFGYAIYFSLWRKHRLILPLGLASMDVDICFGKSQQYGNCSRKLGMVYRAFSSFYWFWHAGWTQCLHFISVRERSSLVGILVLALPSQSRGSI